MSKTPRTCSRFYCDKVKARRCCADCDRRCSNRCINDPARCGLVEADTAPSLTVPGNTAGKKYRSFDPARALNLYHKGLTGAEIAERLGVSRTTIYLWIKNEGLGPKRKGKRKRCGL